MQLFGHFCGIFLVIVSLNGRNCSAPIMQKCMCGEGNAKTGGRIVNGSPTNPNKYPWMAAMFSHKQNFVCGGSIISTKNIITAGHCLFYATEPLNTTWVLGRHVLISKEGISYRTVHYETHPNFVNNTFFDDFDMALVTVGTTIDFNHNVRPICLPISDESLFGKLVIVAGWGRLGEAVNSQLAKVLMETKVFLKTDQQCTDMTKALIKFNPSSMLCAHKEKTDACQGDSGGPLFLETEPNRYEVLGTVSFGDGCARAFPGIYGRIATKTTLNWIHKYIEKSNASVCSDPSRVNSRAYVPIKTYKSYYPWKMPASSYSFYG